MKINISHTSKRMINGTGVLFLFLLLSIGSCQSTSESTEKSAVSELAPIKIDMENPGAEIQPTMYGIFFEDINFAADGGIYAEMIKNRSFEFDIPLMGWSQPASDRFSMNESSGFAAAVKNKDLGANATFLNVQVKNEKGYYVQNSGFRGMGIQEGLRYDVTFDARVNAGNPVLKFELVDEEGNSLGGNLVQPSGNSWKEYAFSFNATRTAMKAKLNIWFEGVSDIDLDMISMFPSNTWKNRPKGMRADLVQLLDDLNPGFLRFPGGCIVEGRILERRYQWKKTVGNIEDRQMIINRWNTEFAHRLTPDYFQSFGLGFFEYFQLAEDMGAEPLPILSCGIACQFNSGELVPMAELDPYIDDALDLIEFANGSVNTEWGGLRASMGHPEPFNMKYIGIGNEQWGPEYIKRYVEFEKAIKSQYPDIIIVSGSGPFPDGEMFEYGWEQLKKLNAEIVDEHYYRNPEWFLENADRYDSYDRNGPKVFAGEYAAQSVAIASPDNKNNWNCALSEAAFMTGLERNADVVTLTSYAPLFAHADGWQWTPDLIWFNNLESYGTPNYYVQKLFSTNPGTHILTTTMNREPVIGQGKVYASSTLDKNEGELILKLVNVSESAQSITLEISGGNLSDSGELIVLSNSDINAENSFENPENISPKTISVSIDPENPVLEVEPQSLNVLRISIK